MFKRRRRFVKRLFKRRSYKRGNKYSSFTSQKGTGTVNIPFKARRTSYSRIKKLLWDSTISKQHYRSYQTVTGAANTNASAALMQISFVDPFTNGSFFWTTGGGAQPEAAGGTVPLFDAKIILRGGKWTLSYTNTSATDVIKVSVWHVYTNPRPDTTIIPTTAGPGWDPSIIPDFNYKYGKVFRNETVILSPLQSWTTERRLGIKSIDQSDFATLIGNTPVILFGLENMSQNASATGFTKHTLNCSFSADAIGTT